MTISYPLTRREVEIEHQNGNHKKPEHYTARFWGISSCPFCERMLNRKQTRA